MQPTRFYNDLRQSARQGGAARGFTDGVSWAVAWRRDSRRDGGVALILRLDARTTIISCRRRCSCMWASCVGLLFYN